ncbi:MAG: zinc metalloprotease, partial [Nitrososphaeraceae archaeon]
TTLIDPDGLVVIPVVFHVLYDINHPNRNIPDYLIYSQIARMNDDFRNNSADGSSVPQVWQALRADIKIEFKLACIKPDGGATNGIIRKQTTVVDFPTTGGFMEAKLSSTGGDDAWPTNTYLNIWVCGMQDGQLGWGTFPWDYGGFTFGVSNTLLDGIVLRYDVVGNNNGNPSGFNLGRIAVHEAGHWFGLYHLENIPQGAGSCSPGDFVADTPPQENTYGHCPTYPQVDNCSPIHPGNMFMNYMSYVDDPCKLLFTTGQKDRMRNYIAASGPDSRYPFISNYFGIKRFSSNPYIVQNNMITVYMKNPACLDVTYSFTGPVTEISHDNQKIIFSVICPSSGTISLTAIAVNYTDTYAFDFENLSPCPTALWPKVYEWGIKSTGSLTKDNFGNIFYSFYSDNMQNNLNHNGASSSNLNSFFVAQYDQSTGYTNWIKPDYFLSYIACLTNSDIRLSVNSLPSIFSHFNSTSGVPVTNNTTLTNTEIVKVETTSGEYLTYDLNSNVFRFHPTIGQPITLPYLIQTYFYSPFTSKLYTRSLHTNGNSGQAYFDVYDIANGTVTLAHSTIQTADWTLINLDNSENLYVVNNSTNNAYLEKYNYLTNTFTPLTINNFNNSNLRIITTPNYYPSDYILVYNKNENKLYSLNFNTNLVRSMATSN